MPEREECMISPAEYLNLCSDFPEYAYCRHLSPITKEDKLSDALAQARKERDVLKRALEQIAPLYKKRELGVTEQIRFASEKATEALASINKDSCPVS